MRKRLTRSGLVARPSELWVTTMEWRWVDIDGTEQVVGVDGLTRMLSSGSLPPYTLVWRTTWLGWHRASEVPELASATGSKTLVPRSIASSPAATTPPPLPADIYPDLQGNTSTLLVADRPAARRSVPPPLRRNLPRPVSAVPSTVRGPAAPPANLPGRSTMIGMVPKGAAPPPPSAASKPQPGLASRSTIIGMVPAPPQAGGTPPGNVTEATPEAPAPPAEPKAPAPLAVEAAAPVAAPAPPPAVTLAGLSAPAHHVADLASQVVEASAPTGPIRIRGVMPTLTEEDESRHTLRPMGALPPPPRTAPRTTMDQGPFSLAGAPTDPAPRPMQLPSPPSVPPAASASPAGGPGEGRPGAAPEFGPRSQPAGVGRKRAVGGVSSRVFTLATGVSLLIPGTVLLVLALLRPRTGTSTEPAGPSAASAAPSAARAAMAGCSLEGPARRLGESASFQVPLLTASTRSGSVAIGFATDRLAAKGIVVDPNGLSATTSFDAVARTPILGVVPLTSGSAVTFAVDEVQKDLAFARTIDAAQPFSIGVAREGFARREGKAIEMLWPGKSDKPAITTPRVAKSPRGGFAVTFRHGGQEGKVLVGWLDDGGHKKSELKAVPTDATLVGTPVVAAGPGGALVAFAAKADAAGAYGIELSRMPLDGAPDRSRRFAIPAGGPGGEAISPSVEALGKDRFLLQWTEGSAGNRAVRVQMLSADLVPEGDAITLSAADQNAGQGVLWVGMDRILALFLSKTEASHDLWGALLKCP